MKTFTVTEARQKLTTANEANRAILDATTRGLSIRARWMGGSVEVREIAGMKEEQR